MGAGPDDPRVPFPVAPGQGPGWAKVAAAVEAAMPPAEIETIYLFRPIKREGREWGTAGVARKSGGEGVRGFTAENMVIVPGKGPGEGQGGVKEVGARPARRAPP